ncbi:GumC family protein [Novosphingobium aerophilum]|uniref:Chain length determinant protein n=1 Tax=Novosphingobium aerophilum TaxID=2839843 RepID=A0A7X1KDS4_9SPHN|nr:Wzz/FepE/Etk N-terminal domain-containing protein [Novosphingobium aerophilum]MBC2653646.1 chain length determinant protein [Novosphingobium aerophilum]
MGLIQYARMMWARRTLIIFSTLGAFVVALTVSLSLPPVYEATSRIMINILRPDPVTGQAFNAQAAKAFLNAQTELIRDYRVAGKVVDVFGWTSNPQIAEEYRSRSKDDRRDFRRWLAQRIIDNTRVSLVDNSNILEITYRANSANTARMAADTIRDAYVEQTLAFRREDTAKTAEWFKAQAQKLSGDLANAERRKAEFEQKNGIVLQENNTDIESEKLKAIASAASMPVPSLNLPSMPNPAVAQLAQIDAQIAQMSEQLGPNHPQLVAMKQQRAAIARAAASAPRGGGGSGGGAASTAAMLDAQTRKVLAQRGLVGEAQRLATEITLLKDQYQKVAARSAELEQQAQSSETGVTLLGGAVSPDAPISPNRLLIALGGVAGGLAIGLALALGLEFADRRVRGIEDLDFPDLPFVAAMGSSKLDRPARSFWYWLGIGQKNLESSPA